MQGAFDADKTTYREPEEKAGFTDSRVADHEHLEKVIAAQDREGVSSPEETGRILE